MKRPSLAERMRDAKVPEPIVTPRAEPAKFHAGTREGMRRVVIPLPPETHRRLKQLTLDTGFTLERIVRDLIEEHLDKPAVKLMKR